MEEIESSAEDYKDKLHQFHFIEIITNNQKIFYERLQKNYPSYKMYKSLLIKNFIYNYSDSKLIEKLRIIEKT
jgi:hypothetical protein